LNYTVKAFTFVPSLNENNMTAKNSATIVGLGQMGKVLAKLLLENDYKVTIWNRTASKGNELVAQGAFREDNIVTAVAASEIIVICVYDYDASNQILNSPGVSKLLNGKLIIQLTTGSPKEAEQGEAWANKFGAQYLDGAIQVAPDQMAKPETTIFVSGAHEAFTKGESLLKIFGGNIKYFGSRVTAAAAMDLASLSYLYGSLLGFFHAVRICEAEGFPVKDFGKVLQDVTPGFIDFMKYESQVIESGDFAVTQSVMAISVGATERILDASKEYRINTEVPQLIYEFFKRAKSAGYEREELAALIKVFRG
jgi:3-hydroxyisobutyrate dehydrogenase-like beta-hydroxyacid dehydrogenase